MAFSPAGIHSLRRSKNGRPGPFLCLAAAVRDELVRGRLNPLLSHRPVVFQVMELVKGHARQRDADRLDLRLGLADRRAPGQRQIAPRVGAVRGPVVLWRLLEGASLLVPLDLFPCMGCRNPKLSRRIFRGWQPN
jgi:hypothetical protein